MAEAGEKTGDLSKEGYDQPPPAYNNLQAGGGYAHNPEQAGYNPQQAGYNPQQAGYNPQQAGYNPQQGGYNPQQGGYYPPPGGYNQPQGQQQVFVNVTIPNASGGFRNWTNGLFGCFNNCSVCILSWCCPCYLYGKDAEFLGESFMVYAVVGFFFPLCIQWFLRHKLRARLGIVGSEIGDCCTTWCCGPCALAQEHNEVILEMGQVEAPAVTIVRE